MIYKRCTRCGKRLQVGQTCECVKQRHKEYDRYSRDKSSTLFYHSDAWKRMRDYILDKYDGLDLYELHVNNKVVKADTVHHIVELREDRSKSLLERNLIPVSSSTHNMIHNMYKKSDKDKATMQSILIDCLSKEIS